ncbi:MAG TPA: trigger factor [Desulfobacteria bacterium]|nr:trigger factor [Desulfobacteria bacterium]
MSVKVDRIEKNRVEMEITVAAADFQQAYDRAYKKVAGQINLPGFRKGKAPKKVVETRVGKEAILEEAYEFAIPEAYRKALDESGVDPVDRPEVEVVSGAEGQDLVFKAKVTVKPEVELGQFKELGIERPAATVTEEQVEANLKSLQERHAKIINLEEGSVENGDTAVIDFEGFVNDVAFPGGNGVDYPLVIGSNTFIPGFEEQLVGAAVGAEMNVNVTFPTEYHSADLAGKEAVFKVTVKGIKRKELTPLDDEFAKDVSEFETLEELKVDVRNKLLKTAEEKAEREYKDAVINKVVENATVEIPAVMVDNRVGEMINEMAQRLQYQGLSFEQYLQYAGTDINDLQEKYKPQAEQSVKTDLVLEAVAKAEGIEATAEEIDAAIEKYAAQYKQEAATFKKILEQRGEVKLFAKGLVADKTVDMLVANN